MKFNSIAERDAWITRRLALPQSDTSLRIVIDTDAANEIDDQFAFAWALRCPAALHVEGLYATPFSFAHRREKYPHLSAEFGQFAPPGIGMQRSFEEIERVVDLLDLSTAPVVLKGSLAYLQGPKQAQPSPACDHLIATAEALPEGETLYVVALGCLTNVASALLCAPHIAEKIVVVWTAGYPSTAPWPNHAFNLEQDLFATAHVFECGVPLVYLPGYHVGAQLRLSLAEMQRYVRGKSRVGDDLFSLFTHNPLWPMLGLRGEEPYSWVIWDIICIAWLLNPTWVPTALLPTPRLDADKCWQPRPQAPPIREGYAVDRDAIFAAFFAALAQPGH